MTVPPAGVFFANWKVCAVFATRKARYNRPMLNDRYGNGLTTSSAAARDAYVAGIDLFLAAGAGADRALQKAIEADEGFALAHLALARVCQASGRVAELAAPLARARALAERTTAREQGQIHALGLLMDGNGPAAFEAIQDHLADHPRDAVAAQPCMGVFGLIGFSGRPGREAEQLAFTTALGTHYGDDWWYLASHAFSQMEAGQTGPAEVSIEASLAQHTRNANAAHYRSHLYYEVGECEAGFAYLADWRRDYDKAGPLHCHISWHVALWALERGDVDTMWQVVDADVDPEGAWGPALNVMTDMAAILYRAELAGVEVPPERWRRISDFALAHFGKPGVAFADVHAALAHAMAGNAEALARILSDAAGPAGELVRRLAEAFQAIAAGRWEEAVAFLTDAMGDHARIGGSRAQRDLIELAMTGCLLRLGRTEEARRLLSIRRPVHASKPMVKGLI